MSILDVRGIYKQFEDGVGVLHGIDLSVDAGEIVCLLGPSGCGKTTLLRLIAGLEEPDRGEIYFEGRDLSSVPVHRRGIGLMFQDFALFAHKRVAANVAFGLRMQKLSRDEIDRRVDEMLALVNLTDLAHRDVNQLSGGERQRVALARSLAPRPKLLMLDEPIGSLDRTLRDRLLDDLRRILKQVGVTVVYVTHDQGEAFAIADRIVLMRQGCVIQSGRPEAVYRQPVDAWAARFLGMQNLLPGHRIAPGQIESEIGIFEVEGGGRDEVTLLIRPEAAVLAPDGSGTAIRAIVAARAFLGVLVRVAVCCESGQELVFELSASDALPQIGQEIVLRIPPGGVVCLD